MDKRQARQEIRGKWREILPQMTTKAKKKVNGEASYICPICRNGEGTEGDGLTRNPKSRDGNGLKCFKCGFSGDIFDLYEQATGTSAEEAFSLLAEIAGVELTDSNKSTTVYLGGQLLATDAETPQEARRATESDETGGSGINGHEGTEKPLGAARTPREGFAAYYEECRKRITDPAAVAYLEKRGISTETAAAYWIGYDPAADPANAPGAMGNEYKPHPCPRLIIPTSRGHYVGRRIDGGKEFSKVNCKGGNPDIFNKRALSGDGAGIFVTEGAFDALSVIEAGGQAVAINSAANTNLLLSAIKESGTRATMVLCLDKDEAGQRAARELQEGLQGLGIPFLSADIAGDYKDPNEALTADKGQFVVAVEKAQQEARRQAKEGEPLPGLLTYSGAVDVFKKANDKYLKLNSFPKFSKTAKIKVHDTVVVAADTGAGKSSLVINFLNDLNTDYPCIYFNLEMDEITVLRRLTAIYSGMELDRIEGYKNDEKTAEAVNISLKAITSRQPLQVIQGAYILQQIEAIVKRSAQGREEPTVVIIDHSLLVDTQGHTGGRYDRFTQVSEGLRKLALNSNIIMFVLLQQSRSGKAEEGERPKNSSLKESGSWENDATQICFLWYDPTAKMKKLLLTKNRTGGAGEFPLNYWAKTQTYREAAGGTAAAPTIGEPRKQTNREKQRQKLKDAYTIAYINTKGSPTLQTIAESADVTTGTVKKWLKEYGGFMLNGEPIDPAGVDAVVEVQEFVKLTPADDNPFDEKKQAGKAREVIRI